MLKILGICILTILGLFHSYDEAEARRKRSYRKAVEDTEVVKNKLFPKKKKFELNGDLGFMLNQSYLNSLVIHLGATYYTSEAWGFGVEGVFFSNQDKPERTCIETFYNDPENEINAQCRGDGPEQLVEGQQTDANYGPAYVPIRELKYILTATATWNPVYGKQLFFMSSTGYFDLYIPMGLGIAASDFYPKETTLFNGKPSRAAIDSNDYGADLSETTSYGIDGRPEPQAQTNPLFTIGVGQKYHFGKLLSVKVELRNYTLLGTEEGFEAFFALWGGVGLRF